jgi:hypothetical protein
MKNALNRLVPSYVENIASAPDPVFRTCEVLNRIDNLFLGKGERPLGNQDKIHILRALRKNLELSMKTPFQISRRQDNPNKSVIELVDRKIDHYKIKEAKTPPPPRVYDRGRVLG